MFSFGHLSLFTITQKPAQLLPPTYTDSRSKVRGRSEVKRRFESMEAAEQLLPKNQSLLKLIKRCLHNKAALRPCTGELLTSLQEIMTPAGEWSIHSFISLLIDTSLLNPSIQTLIESRERVSGDRLRNSLTEKIDMASGEDTAGNNSPHWCVRLALFSW